MTAIGNAPARAVEGPPDLVGRRRELAWLRRHLDAHKRGVRPLLIRGPAGVGKSALLRALSESVAQDGRVMLSTSCFSTETSSPYALFLPMLRSLPEAGETLLAETAKLVSASRKHLGEDTRGQRARYLGLLTDKLLGVAERAPVVLCLDDLQWADPASLLLVNRLQDARSGNLSIVAAMRTDEQADEVVQELLDRLTVRSDTLDLQGLSLAETRQFLESIDGSASLTRAEVAELHALTAGNPLLIRELYTHLERAGLLATYSLGEAAERTTIPPSLTRLIDARLDELSPEICGTGAVVALLGPEPTAETVALVAGVTESVATERLEVMAERGSLRLVERDGATYCAFTHPLFGQRLLERLPPSTRAELHTRIGRAGLDRTIAVPAQELARHLAIGPGPEAGPEGVALCRRTAEAAERILAYETAARFWEYAVRCSSAVDHAVRADLLRSLGWAHWAATRWNAASRAWVEAITLFDIIEDAASSARLKLALGDICRWQLELKKSEQWLFGALAGPLDEAVDRARAFALLASIRCLERRFPEAAQFVASAEEQLKGTRGDRLVQFWITFALLTSGDRAGGIATGRAALALAQAEGDAHAAGLLAGLLFHVELSRLDLDRARRYLRVVKATADRSDVSSQIYVMINSCWLAGLGGKWPAVLRLTGEWLSGMRLAGRYQIATARALRSQACLAFGNPDDAREELERALPDLEQMAPVASLSLAEVMVRRGDTADAMAIVSRFVEDLGDGTPSTTTAGMLGLVSSDLDMPETWALCYEWLKDEPSSLLAVYRPCSLDRIRGRLATRLGRWTEGIQHFNTAIDALRVSGAAWELTQAYCDYAELRRKRGRKGDTRRAAALQAEAEAIAKSLKLDLPSTPRSAVSRMRHGLSEREADVLMLVAQGHRNNEIAESLTISIRTVERHLENIFAKMGVRNRTEAVIEAARTGLLGEVA